MSRLMWSVVVLAALSGCGSRPVPDLADDPAEVTVLSLDGPAGLRQRADAAARAAEGQPPEPAGDTFRGYPVLGRVRVTDPVQKQAVVAAVKAAMRDGPPQAARCFIPRHAVQVDGADVVICFECGRYYVYRGEELESSATARTVRADAQPYFDRLLTDAGVPLAPKE